MIDSFQMSRLFGTAWLCLLLMAGGCRSGEETAHKGPEGPALELTVAVYQTINTGLIAIADEKGYFKEQGLNVTLDRYPSGKAALDAAIAGKAQVATVADFAFAATCLEEPSIRVLASIGTVAGSPVVARRDRNIKTPSDLKNKRVGFSKNTTSEYFLYAFLITQKMDFSDINAVDLSPEKQADAVISGEVDAVSAFDYYAYQARKRLGDNSLTWESQNSLSYHFLLATTEGKTGDPDPLHRLVKALIRAEDFAISNQDETQGILAGKWELDPAFIQESWSKTRLSVSFGQSIVTALQNYTNWGLQQAGRPAAPPDILNNLHTAVLDWVAPKRVTLLR